MNLQPIAILKLKLLFWWRQTLRTWKSDKLNEMPTQSL